MREAKKDGGAVARATYLVYAALMLVWTLAWILKVNLDLYVPWLTTSVGGFVFWTTAKVFIWILPAVWLVGISGRTVRGTIHVSNWRGWLAWGGGAGGLIALTGFVPKLLGGAPLLPTEFSIPLLNVLTVAPVFEEWLMRGAILGNLQQGYSFWTANVISSVMFVGLHLPGWYFMGSLRDNLTTPVGGAFSIFLLGLAFGYAVHRSGSVVAGSLAHFLNNLASA